MATFKDILKEIEKITSNKIMEDLSDIEKDLVREKLRRLYEILLTDNEKDESKPEGIHKKSDPPAVKLSNSDIEDTIHESETDTFEIDSEELILKSEDLGNSSLQLNPESEDPDLFSASDKPQDKIPTPVAEKIGSEINEESVADKIQKTSRIESLKISIGINEKFFFINELFDGNLNDYNEAIEALDKCITSDQADHQLSLLTEQHQWKENKNAVDQLKQFIARKLQ